MRNVPVVATAMGAGIAISVRLLIVITLAFGLNSRSAVAQPVQGGRVGSWISMPQAPFRPCPGSSLRSEPQTTSRTSSRGLQDDR